jgi:hypothetical protein
MRLTVLTLTAGSVLPKIYGFFKIGRVIGRLDSVGRLASTRHRSAQTAGCGIPVQHSPQRDRRR